MIFWVALSMFTALLSVWGFDNSREDNVAVYWGQNSYGATHPSEVANFQKTLSFYCRDDSIDVLPLAFLDVFFDKGHVPSINLTNICGPTSTVFPGTNLANCTRLAPDIDACQAKGKIVTLSLAGLTESVCFDSDFQASDFADQIWNLFLGGSSSLRPFGKAVLDGIDIDISSGSSAHFAAFVNRIRQLSQAAHGKKYYVTASPQCPYPDVFFGSLLNTVAFDAVYIQFFNNVKCSLAGYPDPKVWDFATWDHWATTVSVNKDVKLYIGAPAAPSAATGYVNVYTLASIALHTRHLYKSFGGVMLWDASQAYMNSQFHVTIKTALKSTDPDGSPPPPTCTPAFSGLSTFATERSAVSRPRALAWRADTPYLAGNRVIHNGHFWTANFWSHAAAPGGPSGAWRDNGACSGSKRPPATVLTPATGTTAEAL